MLCCSFVELYTFSCVTVSWDFSISDIASSSNQLTVNLNELHWTCWRIRVTAIPGNMPGAVRDREHLSRELPPGKYLREHSRDQFNSRDQFHSRDQSRSTPEVVPSQGHLVPGVFPLPSHLFPGIAVTRRIKVIKLKVYHVILPSRGPHNKKIRLFLLYFNVTWYFSFPTSFYKNRVPDPGLAESP